MKASRAYIAGLGTTGVLLSFALLLLVVFGAILAARGWPEAPAGGDAGAVRLDAGGDLTRLEPVRLEAAASRTGVPAAAVRAAAVRAEGAAAAQDRGAVAGRARGGDTTTRAATEPEPVADAPSASPAAPSAPSPPAATVPAAAPRTPAAPALPTAAPALPTAAPAVPSVAAPGLPTGAAEGVAETTTGLVQETGATAESALPALP